MTDLSPAAQAVLTTFGKHPLNADHITNDLIHGALPAALEAVADRGECVEIVTAPGFREIDAVLRVSDILAIAAELRGDTTATTQENNR